MKRELRKKIICISTCITMILLLMSYKWNIIIFFTSMQIAISNQFRYLKYNSHHASTFYLHLSILRAQQKYSSLKCNLYLTETCLDINNSMWIHFLFFLRFKLNSCSEFNFALYRNPIHECCVE